MEKSGTSSIFWIAYYSIQKGRTSNSWLNNMDACLNAGSASGRQLGDNN